MLSFTRSARCPRVSFCSFAFASARLRWACSISARARSSDSWRFCADLALPSGVVAPVDRSQGFHVRINADCLALASGVHFLAMLSLYKSSLRRNLRTYGCVIPSTMRLQAAWLLALRGHIVRPYSCTRNGQNHRTRRMNVLHSRINSFTRFSSASPSTDRKPCL